MRILGRLLLTALAVLSLSSAAFAAKPDVPPGQAAKKEDKLDVTALPPGQEKKLTEVATTIPTTPGATTPALTTVPEVATVEAPGQAKPGKDKVKTDKAGALPAETLPADWLSAPLDAAAVGPALFVDPAHTQLGETVGAAPTGGTVLVKVPGSDAWTTLVAGAPLPVGTVIDARNGALEVGAEAVGGVEQHAIVGGAQFSIEQAAGNRGVTDLVLQGGEFAGCRAARHRAVGPLKARAAAKRVSNDEVVRGLWASGKGRFRTKGRNATASVRGTKWITVDRCHSTTVRVVEGIVDVQDRRTGKSVAVRAGQRVVVRSPARVG